MPMKAPPHPGRLFRSAVEVLDLSAVKAAGALNVSGS